MGKRKRTICILSLTTAFLVLSAVSAPCATPQKEAERTKLRAEIQKARESLSGTTWIVDTTLKYAKKPDKGQEVFSFTENTVTTQNLAAQGYSPNGSNYSLRYEADGRLVWETMQRHESGEGEALLRGDLTGNYMTGVIDIQPVRGARKIYSFTSGNRETMAPAAVSASKEVPASTKTTTTTTKTKQPEKKKRGWW